jgi:hypothetical protein
VQVPIGLVKNPLPVRNSSACARVSDRPMNDQSPTQNGKTQEGVQVPKGSVKNQVPVRSGSTRGIQQGILLALLCVAS